MSILFRLLSTVFILISAVLVGCGGGDSQLKFNQPPEPSGVMLSGKIVPAALILVDSDINDPNSTPISNNTLAQAQNINNYSTINGFASVEGTSIQKAGVSDMPVDDNFENEADEADYYFVDLTAGQNIQLEVINYQKDTSASFSYVGDLDLFLQNELGQTVAFSDLSGAGGSVEEIQVPQSGRYYILVMAQTGVSKYVLRIGTAKPFEQLTHSSLDFVPNEAIIRYKSQTVQASSAITTTSEEAFTVRHRDRKRATLATFQTNNLRAFSTNTSNSSGTAFWNELAAVNWETYQKLLTLRAIKQLKVRDDIEYAEPNYLVHPLRVPNDPYYDQQWHYQTMKLPQAWDVTTGTSDSGRDVIVAVIDTGVFTSHEDLQGKLVYGYDFVSDDSDPDDPGDAGTIRDSSWHGTHVAATVAANSNNGIGVSGVSWGAKIMPLRVLGEGGGTDYDVNQAILYAAGLTNDSGKVPLQRADIINLSLGGEGRSNFGQETVNLARDEDVIIVSASGNSGTSAMEYPASYDGVISVGAVNYKGNITPYSTHNSAVDLVAPGGNLAEDLNNDGNIDGVLSAYVSSRSGARVSSYGYMHGTSMATPHVSGVLALMKAVYSGLTPDDVDSLILNGLITEVPSGGRNDFYGYGRLNALKAVEQAAKLAAGGVTPDLPPIYAADPTSLSLASQSNATFELKNVGGPSEEQVTAVETDAVWMSVEATSVDGNGFGTYQITIDRSGLGDSPYTGNIEITIGSSSVVSLQVTMMVGTQTYDSEFAIQYVTLLDKDENVIQQTIPVLRGGNYDYSFSHVEDGIYYIASGSDVDNDLVFCTLGENCGMYPITNSPDLVEVKGNDISNLNFVVGIQSFLNSSSSAFNKLDRLKNGIEIKTTGRSSDQALKQFDY